MRTFRAEKANSGYEVIPSRPLDRPEAYAFEIIPGGVIHPVDVSAGFTKYTPSDVEDLFLEFLNTTPAGPSVVAFANKYGLLGLEATPDGELLAQWAEQIYAVGKAFLLWELHEGRYPWEKGRYFVADVPRLQKLAPEILIEVPVVTAADGKPHLDFEHAQQHEFSRERTRPSLRADLDALDSDGERLRVLRPFLLQEIADVVNANLGRYCGHGFDVDDDGTFAWLREQPKSLLGVIWLQVAWHLTGKRQWRECALDGCHKWFPISNEKPGQRKKFCKDSHRVAACKRRPARLKLRKRRG